MQTTRNETLVNEWSAVASALRHARHQVFDLVFKGNTFVGMPLEIRRVLVEGLDVAIALEALAARLCPPEGTRAE
jgi:hypothetical protein